MHLLKLAQLVATRDFKNRHVFTGLYIQACKTFIVLATGPWAALQTQVGTTPELKVTLNGPAS